LVVLQKLTDSENVQGPCTKICPASSHDVYQAISIKAEVLSDVEEEDPVPITFPGIKAEPEVSCFSMSTLGGFHKYRYKYSLFYKLLLQ
jgi:hypothetical protein